MINLIDIEIAVRKAYALAYPWLFKVERLPGAGVPDVCGLWHGFDAVNEPCFVGHIE